MWIYCHCLEILVRDGINFLIWLCIFLWRHLKLFSTIWRSMIGSRWNNFSRPRSKSNVLLIAQAIAVVVIKIFMKFL